METVEPIFKLRQGKMLIVIDRQTRHRISVSGDTNRGRAVCTQTGFAPDYVTLAACPQVPAYSLRLLILQVGNHAG